MGTLDVTKEYFVRGNMEVFQACTTAGAAGSLQPGVFDKTRGEAHTHRTEKRRQLGYARKSLRLAAAARY